MSILDRFSLRGKVIVLTGGAGLYGRGLAMAGDTDLGGAVVFLLSDASRYITAAMLAVDGGYMAK